MPEPLDLMDVPLMFPLPLFAIDLLSGSSINQCSPLHYKALQLRMEVYIRMELSEIAHG